LLDDVVLNDVSMFRAEMLSSTHLWLACYLPGSGVEGDRITFEVRVGEDGELLFEGVSNQLGPSPASNAHRHAR
jgi:hypothetical protein